MLALDISPVRKMVGYKVPSFPMDFHQPFKFFILKFGIKLCTQIFEPLNKWWNKYSENSLTSSLFHLPRLIFFLPWSEAELNDGPGDIVSDSESESMSGSPGPSIFEFLGYWNMEDGRVSLARYTYTALCAYKMLALPLLPFLVLSLPRSAGSFFSESTLARVL